MAGSSSRAATRWCSVITMIISCQLRVDMLLDENVELLVHPQSPRVLKELCPEGAVASSDRWNQFSV